MKLKLKRIYLAPTYTIGKLYINGNLFCDVLEDKVREDGIKIYGETAIPAGKYDVILTMSNRFKKVLPLLLYVPGFEGIRIHSGNTDKDTHGCLLVGYNTEKGKLTNSKNVMTGLMKILEKADKIEIEIE